MHFDVVNLWCRVSSDAFGRPTHKGRTNAGSFQCDILTTDKAVTTSHNSNVKQIKFYTYFSVWRQKGVARSRDQFWNSYISVSGGSLA